MLKVAYIGGGSMFLPSIYNGVAHEAAALGDAGEAVHFALYDIAPERAQRMARYAEIVADGLGVPLSASVPGSLEEAIEGAGLVFLSIALPGLHEGWQALAERFPLEPHGEGPARTAYEGAKVFEVCLHIGEAMARRAAPNAVFATLVNPTDVLAGAFERRFGIPSCGVCCEVGGLIGMLAHYLGCRFDDFEVEHVGVNHLGWATGIAIRGEDAYPMIRERLPELARRPDFYPVSLKMPPILELTGCLQSSAYHRWPYTAGEGVDWEAAMKPWAGKRERRRDALERALQTGEPIADDEPVHPELSVFQYRELGRHIGQMMAAMATGSPRVVPLQVANRGATGQFPAESIVEVPTLVAGTRIEPQAVGAVPEWLIATERATAISRTCIARYLAEPRLATLHEALAVFPMYGAVEQMLGFAAALHAEYVG